MNKTSFKDIDGYIRSFPKNARNRLQTIRLIIRKHAPAAQEVISYGMPAFRLNGIVVYFAGYKHHIGLYPYISASKKDLFKYKTGKGSIQFPLDQPLPIALIHKIVKYRVAEKQGKEKYAKRSLKIQHDFPAGLSAPALRALGNAKINSLAQLARYNESAILKLHGFGPSSLPKLKRALKVQGLSFAKKNNLSVGNSD